MAILNPIYIYCYYTLDWEIPNIYVPAPRNSDLKRRKIVHI